MKKQKGYVITLNSPKEMIGKKVVNISSTLDDAHSKSFVLYSKRNEYKTIEEWKQDISMSSLKFNSYYSYFCVNDIIPLGRVVGRDIKGKKIRQGDLVSDGLDNENVYQVIDEILVSDLITGLTIDVSEGYENVRKLNATERSKVVKSKSYNILSALELSNQKVFNIEGWKYTL